MAEFRKTHLVIGLLITVGLFTSGCALNPMTRPKF